LYCQGLPQAVAAACRRFWRAWNQGDAIEAEAAWPGYRECQDELRAHAVNWARELPETGDLANNLALFCENLLK
jgi:hypothetical protein